MITATAINPWYAPSDSSSRKQFEYTGKCLLNYRGVMVYYNPAGSWDYIRNGVAMTQRAGFQADAARQIIDQLLA